MSDKTLCGRLHVCICMYFLKQNMWSVNQELAGIFCEGGHVRLRAGGCLLGMKSQAMGKGTLQGCVRRRHETGCVS